MKFVKTILISAALALFISACAEPGPPNVNVASTANSAANANANSTTAATPQATVADELAVGRKVYAEKCVACHKEDGTGGKVDIEGKIINAENLTTDKMKKMDDAKYVKYIEDGIPDEGMPAFKGKLTDDEIKSVVKFIRTELQKN